MNSIRDELNEAKDKSRDNHRNVDLPTTTRKPKKYGSEWIEGYIKEQFNDIKNRVEDGDIFPKTGKKKVEEEEEIWYGEDDLIYNKVGGKSSKKGDWVDDEFDFGDDDVFKEFEDNFDEKSVKEKIRQGDFSDTEEYFDDGEFDFGDDDGRFNPTHGYNKEPVKKRRNKFKKGVDSDFL